MAKKVYEENNIAAIANKIREKTGGESTYKTSEMPSGIDEVYNTGFEAGKAEGVDITDSTVTPETLAEGVIAYNAKGERIVGTHRCETNNNAKLGNAKLGTLILGKE